VPCSKNGQKVPVRGEKKQRPFAAAMPERVGGGGRTSARQLYHVAAVAALGAVLFAGALGSQRGGAAVRGAVELSGALDVGALEQQASQGLPYSEPLRPQMSMIDVVPARMQQLYDTPSVNAGGGGFTNAMARVAPITDCSGLGCVTRVPVRPGLMERVPLLGATCAAALVAAAAFCRRATLAAGARCGVLT
jgi:hypothetical protein